MLAQMLRNGKAQPEVRIPHLNAKVVAALQEPQTYRKLRLGLALTRIPTDVHLRSTGTALRCCCPAVLPCTRSAVS